MNQEDFFITGLHQKDQAVMAKFYDFYSPALYGLILRICTEQRTADRILESTFQKIFDSINLYDPTKERLFTWMLALTRATAFETVKMEDRCLPINQVTALPAMQDSGILQKLTAPAKEILEALVFEGLSVTELSKRLKISPQDLEIRITTATKELHQVLKGEN